VIILTEKAIERTGLQIATVRETQVSGDPAAAPVKRKSVPYASLIYDENGRTWVYISPKERTFVRYPVEVDYIEGDTAILRNGPPPDTKVATYGAAELWGEEGGIGH
jgi:hypothetical protein